jgi:dTDP-4-dehydrorhamnose 3,5-epimerase
LEFLWIPEGFAHGFLVLSETASVFYKSTGFYYREGERCIRWDDPALAIEWPLETTGEPNLSARDAIGSCLSEAELPPPYSGR